MSMPPKLKKLLDEKIAASLQLRSFHGRVTLNNIDAYYTAIDRCRAANSKYKKMCDFITN